MGWLIAAAAMVALWWLPLGVAAVYDTDGAAAWLTVGPVRIPLYPRRKAKSKTRRKKDSTASADDFEKAKRNKSKSGGRYSDFLPIVRDVLSLLIEFKRKLRVNWLELKLILAADDPCTLGVNYGRAWAALGNLMPQLERFFTIKRRQLEVECDFTATQTLVHAGIDLTITLGMLLRIVCIHGIGILKKYHNLVNERKGGAKT